MRVNLVPNKHILDIVNIVLDKFESQISVAHIIQHSAQYVEQNTILLKYTDMSLFEHQKLRNRILTNSRSVSKFRRLLLHYYIFLCYESR